MGRTRLRISACFAAMLAAWQPCAAHAADDETQLWLMFDASMPLDARTNLTFLVMPRFRDAARGEDQVVLRAALDRELSSALSVGGGLTYVVGPDSFRPFQQVELSKGDLSLRFRLEEITGGGVDRLGLRERVQVKYKLNLAEHTSISVAEEWIDSVRSERRDTLPARDQWRTVASVRQDIGQHLHAGFGYTLIIAPARDDLPTRVIHAPMLSGGWSF
ncbi:DUF2490 domain-containing protein [Qipengyuania soli]|uniref:DUF2490 domain-containing protein n=1 Tax=Qipengyuania soli TaxID=2782568 RepID=A0A7S8IUN1_9SPHN|nr:DUF2490 domain-containing protein [Qipengyuania soli]QPC97936.1 DUF2490 domain-containing protein [Qipengyuania soli]